MNKMNLSWRHDTAAKDHSERWCLIDDDDPDVHRARYIAAVYKVNHGLWSVYIGYRPVTEAQSLVAAKLAILMLL